MIRKIDYIDSPFYKKDTSKFAKFAEDIRCVIENKIEYAELVEMPYSDTTANADLAHKSRQICGKYVYEKYGKYPSTTDFFVFVKQNKQDGCHWFVKFDVTGFEKMVSMFELSL